MMTNHPITPPPELVEKWRAAPEYANSSEKLWLVSLTTKRLQEIAAQASRWGADQELEACVEWMDDHDCEDPQEAAQHLRAARRPKPPSLKEQALKALDQADKGLNESEWQQCSDTIRRALEQLPDAL